MSSPDPVRQAMIDTAYLAAVAGKSDAETLDLLNAQFAGVTDAEFRDVSAAAAQRIIAEGGPGTAGLPGEPSPPPGTLPQWEGEVEMTFPDGRREQQYIRVPRSPDDTPESVRDKFLLAQIEIETIIAERGGDYEVSAVIGDFYEV